MIATLEPLTSVAPHPMEGEDMIEMIDTIHTTGMTITGGLITMPVSGLEEVSELIKWFDHAGTYYYSRVIPDSEQWSRRGVELRVSPGQPAHLQRGVGEGGQGPELLQQLPEVCQYVICHVSPAATIFHSEDNDQH